MARANVARGHTNSRNHPSTRQIVTKRISNLLHRKTLTWQFKLGTSRRSLSQSSGGSELICFVLITVFKRALEAMYSSHLVLDGVCNSLETASRHLNKRTVVMFAKHSDSRLQCRDRLKCILLFCIKFSQFLLPNSCSLIKSLLVHSNLLFQILDHHRDWHEQTRRSSRCHFHPDQWL